MDREGRDSTELSLDLGGLADAPVTALNTERVEPMIFTYTDPRDPKADENHILILMMKSYGVDRRDIARSLNLSAQTVNKVLNHGPNRYFLRQEIVSVWNRRFDGMRKMTESFESVVTGLVGLCSDDDKRVRLRAIEVFFRQLGAMLPFQQSSPNPEPDETGSLASSDRDDMESVITTTAEAVPALVEAAPSVDDELF